jgi:hypothetical protein
MSDPSGARTLVTTTRGGLAGRGRGVGFAVTLGRGEGVPVLPGVGVFLAVALASLPAMALVSDVAVHAVIPAKAAAAARTASMAVTRPPRALT